MVDRGPILGEERILVPSPKVLTYDTQPEMSAKTVTQELTNAIAKNEFGLIVVTMQILTWSDILEV